MRFVTGNRPLQRTLTGQRLPRGNSIEAVRYVVRRRTNLQKALEARVGIELEHVLQIKQVAFKSLVSPETLTSAGH